MSRDFDKYSYTRKNIGQFTKEKWISLKFEAQFNNDKDSFRWQVTRVMTASLMSYFHGISHFQIDYMPCGHMKNFSVTNFLVEVRIYMLNLKVRKYRFCGQAASKKNLLGGAGRGVGLSWRVLRDAVAVWFGWFYSWVEFFQHLFCARAHHDNASATHMLLWSQVSILLLPSVCRIPLYVEFLSDVTVCRT